MRLLLLGCSGFVGRELVPQLLREGYQVALVTRRADFRLDQVANSEQLVFIQLDPSKESSWKDQQLLDALNNAQGVINFAGEPIAEKRWTARHTTKIANSRLNTTRYLVKAMTGLSRPPRVLINASAIGYYGTSEDELFTEVSPSGNDFLSSLCLQWEELASEKTRATRLCIIRIGIVIGSDGGALAKMLPVFKAGLGGPIGPGTQWMSWIHRTDLCDLVLQALKKRGWSGVINGVAPAPLRMVDFASTLGEVLGRPSRIPVPGPLLKILLGDGARVVLEGQRVESIRLSRLGFNFKYPKIREALMAAVKPSRSDIN